MMLQGQCLCGLVYYHYQAELEKTILCFCQHCQRAQGAMLGWNSPIDQSKFQIVRGQQYLKEYFHSPNKARVFCQECGSPIYSYRLDLPGVLRLRLGTVTEGYVPAPIEQAFAHRKPQFLQVSLLETSVRHGV